MHEARIYRTLIHHVRSSPSSAFWGLTWTIGFLRYESWRTGQDFDYSVYFMLRSIASAKAGKWKRATKDLTVCLGRRPLLSRVLVMRGICFLKMRKPENALQDFDEALSLVNDDELYMFRASANEDLGLFSCACDDYERALSLNPQNLYANLYYAELLATCPDNAFRNGEKALLHARAACAPLREVPWRFLDVLATSYAAFGKFDAAVSAATQSVKIAPPDIRGVQLKKVRQFRSKLSWIRKQDIKVGLDRFNDFFDRF